MDSRSPRLTTAGDRGGPRRRSAATTPGRRLAPVDEANLVLDQPGQVNVFLVAGLLAPEGFVGPGGPDLPALRAVLTRRIEAAPELRIVPRRAGRGHRWTARDPDWDHHVRLVAPVPGIPGLQRLCGDLMSVPLDRERPLWELLVVPGAAPDRVGIVLRIHHAIADGMAAVDLVQRLVDPREPPTPPERPRPAARPAPMRRPGRTLARLAFGLRRVLIILRATGVGPTVLLGARGPRRSVIFVDADLGDLERAARESGATVNDALLAAASSGYRRALAAAGEQLPARLPVSVPVALPGHEGSANRVGVMLVRLPVGEEDADSRLRLIAEQTAVEKGRARDQGTLEMLRGPLGARLMNRLVARQHVVAGFVTNVPGPPGTLHLAGSRLDAIWPVSVLAANVRLGVAAVSYAGRLWCSVQFDEGVVPGVEFSRAMAAELARDRPEQESPG